MVLPARAALTVVAPPTLMPWRSDCCKFAKEHYQDALYISPRKRPRILFANTAMIDSPHEGFFSNTQKPDNA
jgi:hypothetical protein